MKNLMMALVVAAAAAWAEPGEMEGPGGGHGRHGGHGGHGPDGGPGMDFIHPKVFKELGLTEEQQKRLKDQRLENQKRRIQLRSEKAILELDLENVFATAPVKEAEARKIAEKIAEVDRKALLLRVESMSRFLAGLTAEQHRKVMEHQAEMREKRKAWREEMGMGMRRHGEDGSRDSGGAHKRKGRP